MYDAASCALPLSVCMKSRFGPAIPPAWSNPAMPGDRKWVGIAPIDGPPNASRRAFLFSPATIALRTLMLLNGLIVVFRAMYLKRPVNPPGRNCDLYDVAACLSTAGGACRSDWLPTMLWPVRIFRLPTV